MFQKLWMTGINMLRNLLLYCAIQYNSATSAENELEMYIKTNVPIPK